MANLIKTSKIHFNLENNFIHQFQTSSNKDNHEEDIKKYVNGNLILEITLKPMEIRTFLLDIEYL